MNRRQWLLGATALVGAGRLYAQEARLRRVALASPGLPSAANDFPHARKRLEQLGWVEGRTVEYVIGYGHDDAKHWEPMILELLANKPDILFVAFGAMALIAMKHTKEAPIVFALSSNPEKFGLVASLTRPGGNVTGVSTREQELLGKRIELMREISPGVRRIAMLANPDSPEISRAYLENYSTNARNFGIEVKAYDARSVEDFRPAFDRMRSDQMQGLLNIADTFQFRVRNELVANAARLRLPAIYTINGFVEAGGLASFGTNLSGQFRRAAEYVDEILRGTKPADLPVQEPTRFQLAVNLKAAREQNTKIPPSILVRADQLIE
jgi:putative ABC transport system substrate-binding protein